MDGGSIKKGRQEVRPTASLIERGKASVAKPSISLAHGDRKNELAVPGRSYGTTGTYNRYVRKI